MTLDSFLLLVLAGFVAGTMGSLLGLGGGIFLVPFLTLVLGVPMHQAIATSILGVIATSTAGAALNVQKRIVHVRLGMVLETTTVAGAIAGGLTAAVLSGATLEKVFASLLVIVAALMAWRSKPHLAPSGTGKGVIPGTFYDESTGTDVHYSVQRLPVAIGVSLLAGNVSGLLGVGGGIFKVPTMHLLCGIPLKAATATSNFMIGVTGAASAFIYFSHGHVNPVIASSAILGVLGGSFAGVRLSRLINTQILSWIFVAVLAFVSFQLFTRTS